MRLKLYIRDTSGIQAGLSRVWYVMAWNGSAEVTFRGDLGSSEWDKLGLLHIEKVPRQVLPVRLALCLLCILGSYNSQLQLTTNNLQTTYWITLQPCPSSFTNLLYIFYTLVLTRRSTLWPIRSTTGFRWAYTHVPSISDSSNLRHLFCLDSSVSTNFFFSPFHL